MEKTITIQQAVILAGGLGTRLRPLTDTIPKPMVSVAGRPFLEYLLELLKRNGIQEVVLLLGYLPEKVTEYFGDGSVVSLKIKYSISSIEDDTGTRIKKAAELLDDNFILLYCDNYWPAFNLKELVNFWQEKNTLASVVVYSNKDNFTKNNVKVDQQGYVLKYDRSRQDSDLNGVEIGFCLMNKKIIDMMPNSNFHFEEYIFPRLIAQKQLAGFMTDQKYYSIATLERMKLTEDFFKKINNLVYEKKQKNYKS